MAGFQIITTTKQIIKFRCYDEEAPKTTAAFLKLLPFSKVFFHARYSGQEIWIDDAPELNIIQENASVFTETGEVVFGPSLPARVKTRNCLGIYYGDGRGLDACNIFAKVVDEDLEKLVELGNKIWRQGETKLTFKRLETDFGVEPELQ
jgi:hypothetical protein